MQIFFSPNIFWAIFGLSMNQFCLAVMFYLKSFWSQFFLTQSSFWIPILKFWVGQCWPNSFNLTPWQSLPSLLKVVSEVFEQIPDLKYMISWTGCCKLWGGQQGQLLVLMLRLFKHGLQPGQLQKWEQLKNNFGCSSIT